MGWDPSRAERGVGRRRGSGIGSHVCIVGFQVLALYIQTDLWGEYDASEACPRTNVEEEPE